MSYSSLLLGHETCWWVFPNITMGAKFFFFFFMVCWVRDQFEEGGRFLNLNADPTSVLYYCEDFGNLLISFPCSKYHDVNILIWETGERMWKLAYWRYLVNSHQVFATFRARLVRISPPNPEQFYLMFI